MRRRFSKLLLAAALAVGVAAQAKAATAIMVTAYEVGPYQESFKAFDGSLGTLTSVRFDITGQVQPVILSDSVGQVEPLFIDRTVTRLFPGQGYSTGFAPQIMGSIVTTSPGEPAVPLGLYVNSFTFDALSELLGFAFDTYGATQVAHLSDFIAGGPLGDQIVELVQYQAYAIGQSGAVLPSVYTALQGGGIVTYTYEVAETGGGVPEPAPWALMIMGFGLAGARMRRIAGGRARA